MNLLMVTAGLPRPIGGANTRNFHLLKALSQEYRVSLLEQAFAQDVIDLMQNTEKCKALGNAGRILVETAYSWEGCGNQILHVLETHFEERENHASTTGA
jgi:hypothetical protein